MENSSTADLLKGLMTGTIEAPASNGLLDEEEGTVVRSENSELDQPFEDDSEDTPPDSQSVGPASPKAKTETSDVKEVITVTDESGRKRKIEIDYNDRAAIKKAHEMANGARKWQAERDQQIQSRKAIEKTLSKREEDWSALEKAFQQGEEHLFDLLKGRPGSFKAMIQKEVEKAKFLENASPSEIKALENEEAAQRQAKELEQIRKENAEFKEKVLSEREATELRAVESRVHPVFEKYRFADKLGDANDEHMFDEMLWNSAIKRLQPYEEQGLDLSAELVEREFRTVAQAIRKRINVQAEKKAGRTLDQKKKEATENVQAKVMSGYRSNGLGQEARDLLNQGSGGITTLLKNMNKYGSLFRK